ncbi:membrane metallo-endopeptidase-like 1 [Haemaphysalis longicornis]
MLFTEREASSQHRPGSLAAASVFRDLVRAASRLLSSASWMGENAQKEALTILRDVKVEASTTLMTHGNKSRQWLHSWPGGAGYPAPVPVLKASTGFEAWLEAARLQKRLTPSWPLDDSLLNRHGRFSPVVAYSPWWNSLFIHPSVLAAPLFYVDAPISVVYGGLGSLLAAAVVRPFDMKVGSFLDANRTVRDWISPSGRSALRTKKACAESEELLMNLASVEVLLEAYQSSRVREDDDVYTLPGTHHHKLTRDMLFFVSFCRARCGLTHECKKTLKHVAAFTKAFRCPRGVGNCSFFGG